MSRHLDPPSQLSTISYSTPVWLAEVADGYIHDPFSARLLQELAAAPQSRQPYTLQDGIIHYKGRIWIGDNKTVQERVMTALHSSAIGGHSGFPVTQARIKKLFAWHDMKATIRAFVAACIVCI